MCVVIQSTHIKAVHVMVQKEEEQENEGTTKQMPNNTQQEPQNFSALSLAKHCLTVSFWCFCYFVLIFLTFLLCVCFIFIHIHHHQQCLTNNDEVV